MLTRWEKIKLALFGKVKGNSTRTFAERLLERAARFGDLEALRYLKKKDVPEMIAGKWHALTYADLSVMRQMIGMGYGRSIDSESIKKIVLDQISSDRNAFVDPETIPFCRRLGISMGIKDKNGNNTLLVGQSGQSIQCWAEQAHISQVSDEFVAAAGRNDADMMRILNRSGKVNLEARVNGQTAAFAAISNGHERASLWLLKHRAKMNTLNAKKQNAFETEKGKVLGPKLLQAAVQYNLTESVQELLNSGIPADNPNLMLIAANNGNKQMMDLLHENGALAQTAQSDYARRLDNLTRHETYDESAAQQIRGTLALLRKYTERN